MNPHDFLLNLAMVFGIAGLVTVLFQSLKLPVVLGYLSAGLVIGPHVPVPLVADPKVVGVLAELGVIMLMFAIGLELKLSRLFALLPTAGPVALAEVALTGWVAFQLTRLSGWSETACIFAAAMAAISSTAVVAKVFEEQKIGGRWRMGVFGVLVVEDVLAVLLLAGLGVVAQAGTQDAGAKLSEVLIKLVAGLPLLVGIGALVVPPLMRRVVALKRPETVVVSAIGLCFGLALLTYELGWSVALGAFLAGTLTAEAGVGKEVEHTITPIKDLFGALFFVSVGMSIDPSAVWAEAPVVIGLTLGVVVAKFLAVSLGMLLVGEGLKTAVQSGSTLGQIGEFSFVIAGLGAALPGGDRLLPVAGAVALLTSTTTPYAVRSAGRLAERIEQVLPHRLQRLLALYGGWMEQLKNRPRTPEQQGGVGSLVWLVAIDLGVILGILMVHTRIGEQAGHWLASKTGLPDAVVVTALSALLLLVVAFPLFGLQNTASKLATFAVAPLRLRASIARLVVGLVRVGILSVLGVLLLLVTMPFVPPLPMVIGLAIYLGLLLRRLWRESQGVEEELGTGTGRLVQLLLQGSETAAAPIEVLAEWGAPRLVRIREHLLGESLISLNLRAKTGATAVALVDPTGKVYAPTGRESLTPGWSIALAGPQEAITSAEVFLTHPPT